MFKVKAGKRRRDGYNQAMAAAIVDSSFDAIIGKDLSGTIVSWNRAAQRVFGFTADEAIGRSINILIPEERHDEGIDLIQRVRLGDQIKTFESIRKTRAGTHIPVSISISPIKDRRGRTIGASKIVRDMSESKENERRLKLLTREINHRVKNQYAVILAVIAQTAAREADITRFETRVRERVMALSHSHDLLSSVDWAGVDLKTLVSHQVQPVDGSGKISCFGPDILLDANAVLNIGMALHELVINYARFGDRDRSRVYVYWTIEPGANGDEFHFTWREACLHEPSPIERGGGFGLLVLKHIVALALGGKSTWTMDQDSLVWNLTAPVARIQIQRNDVF